MWSDEERENKWIEKLESGIRWIGGIKTNEKNRNEVERAIAKNRIKNKRLGYKSKAELISIAEQERRRRIMLQELRMTKETTQRKETLFFEKQEEKEKNKNKEITIKLNYKNTIWDEREPIKKNKDTLDWLHSATVSNENAPNGA